MYNVLQLTHIWSPIIMSNPFIIMMGSWSVCVIILIAVAVFRGVKAKKADDAKKLSK